ncbi:hypothetical protein [Streptomyces mangrovisoli]|uniref:PPE family domain-containing protein n=1 Tax=Streptomyces mangrovisoli TaxID=1428628 RepID=A0A1J4NVW7_9ACTN|nr:hypothetical protein [Streptomyces mangrovisoli]OIJ65652.1 hypothetical protein WN71_022470 [Streptomyces mangrovisoli]
MTDKHKADLDRVSGQNSFTDFARGIEDKPKSGGFLNNIMRSAVDSTAYGHSMHGRTQFEDYHLNRMVDIVEATDPEDLESSGKALWDARDAIKSAATELGGHIENVTWVGESGDAFRTWGRSLVTNTHALSDFAGGAGDQITAAAVGLASVRNAMPPRDPRSTPKAPTAFPKAKQVKTNDAYTAAVHQESNRQEAINQMNRLSSYYAVSRDELATLNETAPTFESMPDVGVPKPKGGSIWDSGSASNAAAVGHTSVAASSAHHSSATPATHTVGHQTTDTPAPVTHTPGTVPHADTPTAPAHTHIDTVGTLPTTTVPSTGHNPPATGSPSVGGGASTIEPSPVGPLPVSGRGISGAGGMRGTLGTQGRAGTSGMGESGTGRTSGRGTTGQMGRATETAGRSLTKGSGAGGKASAMGRGVTGGTPRATGTRAGGGPSTGAGRSNGVVGGRPTSATGSGKNGSRIPRGNVIGAEEETGARPATGRPGQRGVFGAAESTGRTGANSPTSRAGTGSSEAVTGRPAATNSAARAERNGMTRGGSGLVRGTGGHGRSRDREHDEGTARPDYLVEDEETHLPDEPRRDVPPVVD